MGTAFAPPSRSRPIDADRFVAAVRSSKGIGRDPDPDQWQAVLAPADESLFIVAGPGSGKTTVLALRVLKLAFADGIDPASILATTFTRKAATELRGRVTEWGERLRRGVLADLPVESTETRSQVESVDLNTMAVGTLDSLAQQLLSDFRPIGAQPPVAVESFVADAMMSRHGLRPEDRGRNEDLLAFANAIAESYKSLNRFELVDLLRQVSDRIIHDQVNSKAFLRASEHPGTALMLAAINDYRAVMSGEPTADYAAIEQLLLQRLQAGELSRFTDGLRAVLVDEYQDTNLLQERIYLALGKRALANGGSLAVVGDDDQSLYRFRGATVELFSAFPQRTLAHGIVTRTVFLRRNYRSRTPIVSWCSIFASLDPAYQVARVRDKPPLIPARHTDDASPPVLGLFRSNAALLARDLARVIDQIFRGDGLDVPLPSGRRHRIVASHDEANFGDCAVLCSSPAELTGGGNPRFPKLLADSLGALSPPIRTNNPRGVAFHSLPGVRELCGLMLECIDPGAELQQQERFEASVQQVLHRWRQAARSFIATDPPDPSGRRGSLRTFVSDWQSRRPQDAKRPWPREVPVAHLLYQLVAWLPEFQQDPVGLAHLEPILRSVTQSAQLSNFRSNLVNDPQFDAASIRSALWLVFRPLAAGDVEPEEALVGALPRDKVNILSIHQSKGLEFPMVVVDVGSEFPDQATWHAFRRFPTKGSRAHLHEDLFRPFSPIGRPDRSAVDRAFDDLTRQFFVAFSRAQDVLLLVGCGNQSGPFPVRNVATGWTRDGWDGRDRLPPIVLL